MAGIAPVNTLLSRFTVSARVSPVNMHGGRVPLSLVPVTVTSTDVLNEVALLLQPHSGARVPDKRKLSESTIWPNAAGCAQLPSPALR